MSATVPKVKDNELDYDDKDEGSYVEDVALKTNIELNPKALPTKLYLDQNVVPFVTKALDDLAKERPRDPVEYFAYYLLANHPKRQQNQ